MKVKPFGIEIVLIEPGGTGFTSREWTAAASSNTAYGARASHAIEVMDKSERSGPPADKVARIVARAIAARKPKLGYVSTTAMERIALVLQRLLPGRAFEAMIAANHALPKSRRSGD